MNKRRHIIKFLLVFISSLTTFSAFAQNPTDSLPNDPAAIIIHTVQDLSFGAFTSTGGGGSVIIATDGSRSATGSIILLNNFASFFQAIFDIEAPSGSVISILNGPNVSLTGSNGGSMTLTLGASDPASPFLTSVEPPSRTPVSFGGTLTVGNSSASPPGNYTGTFAVTFSYE